MKYLIWGILVSIYIIGFILIYLIIELCVFLWHLNFKHCVSWKIVSEYNLHSSSGVLIKKCSGEKTPIGTFLRLFNKLNYV